MALTKTINKSGKGYKVTFSLPVEVAPKSKDIRLVGEFNNWESEKALILKKKKDNYVGAMDLIPGRYEFRYLIDNDSWANDWEADSYVPSEFPKVENSVLTLNPIVKSKPQKAKTISTKRTKKVDFTIIEGIGPKINELILAAGITTVSKLSKTKPAKLKTILSAAGSRFKMHDPASWPLQAGCIAKDDLVGLKKLQLSLKGGK